MSREIYNNGKLHRRVVNRYYRSVNKIKKELDIDVAPLKEVLKRNKFFMIGEFIDDLSYRIEQQVFSSIRGYLKGEDDKYYCTCYFQNSIDHTKVENDFSMIYIPLINKGINRYIEAQGDNFYVEISGIHTIPENETENSKITFTVTIIEKEEEKVC